MNRVIIIALICSHVMVAGQGASTPEKKDGVDKRYKLAQLPVETRREICTLKEREQALVQALSKLDTGYDDQRMQGYSELEANAKAKEVGEELLGIRTKIRTLLKY